MSATTILHWASVGMFALVIFGLASQHLMRFYIWLHLRRPKASTAATPGISILKPLCGIDDDLEQNLELFARLDYPAYEVLLGVKDPQDTAYPLAQEIVRKYPDRFSLYLQQGEPGMNPKVNQLATLELHAQHDILLVSDSNARVGPGYLPEIAALFEDPQVACVANPVTGRGHVSFGALMDNVHLATAVFNGQIGAKLSVDKDVVVGKSMAVRKDVMKRLGGFAAHANYLAEDYIVAIGITQLLKLKIALARTPVWNYAVTRTVESFYRRYKRWGVIHRTSVTLATSLSQGLLNPTPLAVLAFLLSPSKASFGLLVLATLIKLMVDVSTARAADCAPLGWRVIPAILAKDFIIFVCWANGLVSRTVEWRGNKLKVTYGSLLVLPDDEPADDPAPAHSS